MANPKYANCELRRVHLTRGGYEVGTGTYYGHGQPIYEYVYDGPLGFTSGTLRASSRDKAKSEVLSYYKTRDAVFYR